jgi:hypothetical protein
MGGRIPGTRSSLGQIQKCQDCIGLNRRYRRVYDETLKEMMIPEGEREVRNELFAHISSVLENLILFQREVKF